MESQDLVALAKGEATSTVPRAVMVTGSILIGKVVAV